MCHEEPGLGLTAQGHLCSLTPQPECGPCASDFRSRASAVGMRCHSAQQGPRACVPQNAYIQGLIPSAVMLGGRAFGRSLGLDVP